MGITNSNNGSGKLTVQFTLAKDYNNFSALPPSFRESIEGHLTDAHQNTLDSDAKIGETIRQLKSLAQGQNNQAALDQISQREGFHSNYKQNINKGDLSDSWRDLAGSIEHHSREQGSFYKKIIDIVDKTSLDVSALPFDMKTVDQAITDNLKSVIKSVHDAKNPQFPGQKEDPSLPLETLNVHPTDENKAMLHIRAISRASDSVDPYFSIQKLADKMRAYEEKSASPNTSLIENDLPEALMPNDFAYEQYRDLKHLHEAISVTDLNVIQEMNDRILNITSNYLTTLNNLTEIIEKNPQFSLKSEFAKTIETLGDEITKMNIQAQHDIKYLEHINQFEKAELAPSQTAPNPPTGTAGTKIG